MGAFTNALRLEGYWNVASRRPRQHSPPRYPPLSLPSAQNNPEREAPGIGPRGAPLFQPPGEGRGNGPVSVRVQGRGRGVRRLEPAKWGAAAASPLPHSPSAPPPLPRTRRVPSPSETIRRASAGAAAAPGGPTEPGAETGGARPDPGWPQPGPPSPRALTSARDADSRRTSGRRATARAAGAGADAKGRGLCWGEGSHWPPESPRPSCVLGAPRPLPVALCGAWVIHSRLVRLLSRWSPSAATVHQDHSLVRPRPCAGSTSLRLCQEPRRSGGASALCPSPPLHSHRTLPHPRLRPPCGI